MQVGLYKVVCRSKTYRQAHSVSTPGYGREYVQSWWYTFGWGPAADSREKALNLASLKQSSLVADGEAPRLTLLGKNYPLCWGAITVKIAGDRVLGFTEVPYGDKRSRPLVSAAKRDQGPVGKTVGTYELAKAKTIRAGRQS